MIITITSILLTIISGLEMQAMYSSNLSYKSVTTSQQMTQQFLVAEYALKKAEQWLEETEQIPAGVEKCTISPCILIAGHAYFIPQQHTDWWTTNNKAITEIKMNLTTPHHAYYAIEEILEQDIHYYRITARGLLATQSEPTLLQSTWIKTADKNYRQSWRQW